MELKVEVEREMSVSVAGLVDAAYEDYLAHSAIAIDRTALTLV